MAKQLKLNIKNTQIAKAIDLSGLKDKLAKKKAGTEQPEQTPKSRPIKEKSAKAAKAVEAETAVKTAPKEEAPRIKARSKSVFAEPPGTRSTKVEEEVQEQEASVEAVSSTQEAPRKKTAEELRREIFGEEVEAEPTKEIVNPFLAAEQEISTSSLPVKEEPQPLPPPPTVEKVEHVKPEPRYEEVKKYVAPTRPQEPVIPKKPPQEYVKLGPTGRHVKDLIPPPKPVPKSKQEDRRSTEKSGPIPAKGAGKSRGKEEVISPVVEEEGGRQKGFKTVPSAKDFRDLKPATKRAGPERTFDARDRHGLRDAEEEQRWRKRRGKVRPQQEEIPVVRPTSLKVRVPISIKDLAGEMKLKASELIAKLFLQGVIATLNDLLSDETTIQLLGQEFGCEITLDTSEAQRIRITDKTVKEEIKETPTDDLTIRPPIVAFMGHVDHGKTSLIDSIRKSNRAAGEAGAITQHIGAFRCHTDVGDITILDTPGHEAFSAMRARGADVTDIVVLVVAGDEGIRQQTIEAIHHARSAKVTIVVAINKADKPAFNPDNVYRQLADNELLPEVWGGQILTVNCSAVTGAGIKELLETLALQAEVLELKAYPKGRARGAVLESEMHKGMGPVATVLVQNGTLRLGDALVFSKHWGHVKTMRDEFGNDLKEAPPSTPVLITGLSGLPEAGEEFIAVKNEREAREIAEERMIGLRQAAIIQKKSLTAESLLLQATPTTKKMLNIVLRADVQGSLEAMKAALEKIESKKADLTVIFAGVGEISESDIQLAATSKGIVLGFHTGVESHAEQLIKQHKVQVRLHDIIYHAVDDVKEIMTAMLDKIAQETERGKAEVKAVFKSSQVGNIAGCIVIEGSIQRSHQIRVMREGKAIAKSQIASLKRVKEDVREVVKGLECGIALSKFSDIQVGDILEAYEITYISQEL